MPLKSLVFGFAPSLRSPCYKAHQAGRITLGVALCWLWLQVCLGLKDGLEVWSSWTYSCLQLSCKHSPGSPKILLHVLAGSLVDKEPGGGNCQGCNWQSVRYQPATTCNTENFIKCSGLQSGNHSSSKSGGKLITEITLAQLLLPEFTLLHLIFLPWENHC